MSANSSTDTNANTTSINETVSTNSMKQGTPSKRQWTGEYVVLVLQEAWRHATDEVASVTIGTA